MSYTFLQRVTNCTCSLLLLSIFLFSPVVSAIPYANATGGFDGSATLGLQILQQGQLSTSAVANTTTAAQTTGILGLNLQDFAKEFALDNLAFTVAKNMVNQMTQSMLNWINSGFEDNPAFVTDLNQLLLTALDDTAGEFIAGLGGIGEFICSPFQLDVQFALEMNYAQARSGMPSGGDAPGCRLSDIGNNVENFLGGFAEGGLDDWLTITSNPQNTPYGAYLAAEAELNLRLRNAAGQELEVTGWGDGFLSSKVCQAIEGTSSDNCTITTPGRVISEALTFQLSTGPRALIEADEFNEIIGALINQLTLQAMQGVGGLLGLTSGTGFTDYSYDPSGTASVPFIDAAINQNAAVDSSAIVQQVDQAIAVEQSFLTLIAETRAGAVSTEAVLNLIESERANSPDPENYDPALSTTTIRINGVNRVLGDVVRGATPVTSDRVNQVLTEANQFESEIITHLAALNDYRQQLSSINEANYANVSLNFLNDLSAGAFHTQEFVNQQRLEWRDALQ